MKLDEIVMKLVGPVMPIGESNADSQRLENLRVLTMLIEDLLYEVAVVSKNKDRHEASMKKAGVLGDEFLSRIKE
jgi:hypothetical protein